jgi:hypothetical protein
LASPSSGNDEVMPLSEDSEVLEFLFQYMYLRRPTDLKNVEFDILARVAEAAEKYRVFGNDGTQCAYGVR